MSPTRNKTLTVAAIGTTVLAVSMLGLPSQAATGSHHTSAVRGDNASQHSPSAYDARTLSGPALVRADRAQVKGQTKSDKAFARNLGGQAVVDYDPLTHTPRNLGRLNGYLTGRSSAPARTIAMGYVRSHLATLGLTSADLSTFRFRQDYVDTIGVHNLSWSQSVRGIPVFGNGLKVKVTSTGRVLSVQGSPVSGLIKMAAGAPVWLGLLDLGPQDGRARRGWQDHLGARSSAPAAGGLPPPCGPTTTTPRRSGS